MRLRSSHFIFLVLLLCSVQVREALSLQIMEGAIADGCIPSRERSAPGMRGTRAEASPKPGTCRMLSARQLDSAARRVAGVPWAMRRPASAAVALSTYTSLMRA